MMNPENYYRSRLKDLGQQRQARLKRKSLFGILRFGSIVAIVLAFYFLWNLGWVYVAAAVVLLLVVFARLIHRDLANRAAIQRLDELLLINNNELKALEGHYGQFPGGTAYIPREHYYANDMDILGHASLYQFLNRTSSEMGASQLASWLLAPADRDTILQRQEAVKELSQLSNWRQELQATGTEFPLSHPTKNKLIDWLQEPTQFLGFGPWRWLRWLLPAIILGITVATIFGQLSMNVFYISLFIFAILAYQVNKLIAPMHSKLSKMVDELDTLTESLELIEQQEFKAPLLVTLKNEFAAQSLPASKKIRQLKKILDRLDLRYNIVLSAPLNILLLWNLQQVLDLEQWKSRYPNDPPHWFDNLGLLEALNSLAVAHFNQPGWAFPVIKEEHFFIEATELGHPLIPAEKRVNNYINITHDADIMLVTGSNMAGKSTYLRSVGINVVLAMAGAPVCARSFAVSHVQLISSMRISDNLEENTSTFYAELKKLKTIIEKVNNHEPVFILLDEILRGTNSLDRHTGSVALIKQLIKKNAAAIIATHDVDLAELEKEFPGNINNYHFDVQVNGEELYFDYRLKPGVCTSLNASILMKKIGIEL